ncbi:hypothetical protein [Polaromonas aquatica]|uniref:Transcriptional regulator n=1 Tax=Polaromonas aquatica TaxID=332657 RepID=A0ABW1TW34_9BURK
MQNKTALQISVPESAMDITLRVCPKTRVFSGGEIQMFATAAQFDNLVREIVAHHAKRILTALDGMDRGCITPGFRGHQNGYGEESAGDELEAAREELVELVGHVAVEEFEEPETPWVETSMERFHP